MGRRKKTDTTTAVKSFSETKEDSIAIFSKKENLSIEQSVIDAFEVKPIGKTNKLGGDWQKDFIGKTYEDSLNLAYEWKDRYEAENKDIKVKFVNYYPQEFNHKSIIISYNIKVKQ